MERYVIMAACSWVGGVGAYAFAAGAAMAPRWHRAGTAPRPPSMLEGDELPPSAPPSEVIADLPEPPVSLESAAPQDRIAAAALRSADATKQLDAAAENERRSLAAQSTELLRPPDREEMSALLTESQRRRLAPINSLRRKRRSRRLRVKGPADDKFVPLVPGARTTADESILNAYQGDTVEQRREQGEDYWIDPSLVQQEIREREKTASRRSQYKLREKEGAVFQESKLREEIVAPYKGNVIGTIVISVGVAAVVISLFPNLLELPRIAGVAEFPDTL